MTRSPRVDTSATRPRERLNVPLSELTTLRLGGRARRVVDATLDDQVVEAVVGADAVGEPLLVIAGGSNLVIADAGFEGTVVRILTRGVSANTSRDRVRLLVAAGEPWDELVARGVADGLAGIECLSGIPGSTGATPIQNVGAYGQQVAETIVSVRAYDREAGAVVELTGTECDFAYRSSMFRHSARHVVLGVSYALERSSLGRPVRYPALSESGSFFVNPILSAERFAALERRVAGRLGEDVRPPAWPEADGRVKTSAAWLIERAGFHRGYGEGRVGISQKHPLALVNRGGASTAELIALAREVRDELRAAFEITLLPEPTFVGVELEA